jgi:hypothetical protein
MPPTGHPNSPAPHLLPFPTCSKENESSNWISKPSSKTYFWVYERLASLGGVLSWRCPKLVDRFSSQPIITIITSHPIINPIRHFGEFPNLGHCPKLQYPKVHCFIMFQHWAMATLHFTLWTSLYAQDLSRKSAWPAARTQFQMCLLEMSQIKWWWPNAFFCHLTRSTCMFLICFGGVMQW